MLGAEGERLEQPPWGRQHDAKRSLSLGEPCRGQFEVADMGSDARAIDVLIGKSCRHGGERIPE